MIVAAPVFGFVVLITHGIGHPVGFRRPGRLPASRAAPGVRAAGAS